MFQRMDLVRKAQRFAAEKHRGQRRKYTEAPYTDHLRNVVSLLRGYGQKTPHVIAAAWLHDTVEKTETTLPVITAEFGDGIAELVYWLTDTEADTAVTTSWRLGGAPWDGKLIKIADIIDNGRDVLKNNRDAAPSFIAEKSLALQQMERREGDLLRAHPLFHVASMLARTRDNVVRLS